MASLAASAFPVWVARVALLGVGLGTLGFLRLAAKWLLRAGTRIERDRRGR